MNIDLNYYRKVNGIKEGQTNKDVLVQEMVDDYNRAHDNIITAFDVEINSKKAEMVKVNGVDKKVIIRGVNNKNTSESNFFIEIKSYLGEIKSGDIVERYDIKTKTKETFIVTSLPEKPRQNYNYDVNYLRHCNQTLNWKGLKNPQPCHLTSNSYGAKGAVHNNPYLGDFDSRIVIQCQKNEYTESIFEGMRLAFAHSKTDIYEVTKKIGVLEENTYNLICKFSKYVKEDDLVNNIAFNPELNENEELNTDTYKIEGEDKIEVLSETTYDLNPDASSLNWYLDEDSRTNDYAVIIKQGNSKCTIKALKPNEIVILYVADYKGKIIAQKTIFTMEG